MDCVCSAVSVETGLCCCTSAELMSKQGQWHSLRYSLLKGAHKVCRPMLDDLYAAGYDELTTG